MAIKRGDEYVLIFQLFQTHSLFKLFVCTFRAVYRFELSAAKFFNCLNQNSV